jgi:hypothetical protein
MLLGPRTSKWRIYERYSVETAFGENKTGIVLDIENLMAIVLRQEDGESQPT